MDINVVATVTCLLCFPVLQIGSGTTFKNAQAFCRKHQYQMLADRNDRDRTLLKNSMVERNWNDVWLAISGTKSKNFTWLDGQEEAPGDTGLDGNNCGYHSTKSKYLGKSSCANTSPGFLCQDNTASCGTRHNCIEAFGRAFVYSCNGLSWYEARTTCLDRGMDLAVIYEPAVQRHIFKRMDGMNCDAIWVGLRREAWFYLSNNGRRDKEIMNPKWGKSEPSDKGNCVVLHKNEGDFKWKAVSCTSSHYTLCYLLGESERERKRNIALIVGLNLIGIPCSCLLICLAGCIIGKIYKKTKQRMENEEQVFLTEAPDISMDQIAPPPYDTNTDWYADSEGGRYSAEYQIDLSIPGGAVPKDETYKISRFITNDIYSCQDITGQQNHRVMCPVVQFECLEDFLKPVTIRLPLSISKQHLLREARVLFQEPGTTKWFTVNSDNTTGNALILVGDQNANEEEQRFNNLFMTYEITVKTLIIHTKHLGKFMCSMPAPSVEDTSMSVMLFAHVTEDPSDKIVQEVHFQAVVLDNMYNLPCFQQNIYEEYGGKPVMENILITLPADRHTGNPEMLQIDLGTREGEDWTVFGSSASQEKTETSFTELHERLKNVLAILVCEIHLQNKGTKVNSVLMTASFSVGQEDLENGMSNHGTPVTKNFRISLRPPEEDQLQEDFGCRASSTEGSSSSIESRDIFDSGRNVRSPTTYNKPSDRPSAASIDWRTLL